MKNALRLTCIRICTVLFLTGVSISASAQDDPLPTVLAFDRAFNAHDVDAMADLLSDEFVWLSLNGDSLAVDARGKDDFRAGMESYFVGIPTVQSEMSGVTVAGRFVSYIDRVTYDQAGVEETRAALAVYEVIDGLIRRAWYYPSF